MIDADRATRISSLVENYLKLGESAPTIDEYLTAVDADVRDEVSYRCRDAAFVEEFFTRLRPLRLLPALPTEIGGCRLGELLGEGSMGKVYRATQIELNREVALKLVRADDGDHDDLLARLRDESRALAALDHPGIVKVLFCGEADGWLYFAMELVGGRSLAEILPSLLRHEGGTAPRRFDRAVRIVAEMLDALAYAHGQGFVHRDLKPSNVVLDADDHPKLVDFGLAKHTSSAHHTMPGQLVGTPAYMSPELVARRVHDRFAPDLWATGTILFQLLTGRLPYAAPTTDEVLVQLLRPIGQDPRRLTADVPKPLALVCSRALAPDPTVRYGSAVAFAADLRRFLAGEPIDRSHATPWASAQRHLLRHRHAYAAAVIVAGVLATVWLGAMAHADQRRAADELAATTIDGDPQRIAVLSLVQKVATVRRLLEDPVLTPEQRATARARLHTLEAEGRRRYRDGTAGIVRGAGSAKGAAPGGHRAPLPAVQAAGMRLALEGTMVVPDLPPPSTLLETAWPVLHITPSAGGGTPAVRIDAIDPITGQSVLTVANGVVPCEFTVPLGQYRIVVGDAIAFAECSRTLIAPGDYHVTPILVPTSTAQNGMITIAAGSAIIGQNEPGAIVYAEQTVDHPAFLIDRTEVTCSDYHEFCVATQAPLPRTWNGAYDPAWANLPVVGVAMNAARSYAEWRGKRLPTWTEWQIAARGPTGRRYPWGDDPAPLAELPTIGQPRDTVWHVGVRPVGTTPVDASWCGALDMLGNVDELTDTPYVATMDGFPFPFPPWRLCGGCEWKTPRDSPAAQLSSVGPSPPEILDDGFRCAKSTTQ
jgi:formylglycine-generating enzyme required for sulfatase activity/tRNA A-37 threonylcarbamoyl transferase component Bud32